MYCICHCRIVLTSNIKGSIDYGVFQTPSPQHWPVLRTWLSWLTEVRSWPLPAGVFLLPRTTRGHQWRLSRVSCPRQAYPRGPTQCSSRPRTPAVTPAPVASPSQPKVQSVVIYKRWFWRGRGVGTRPGFKVLWHQNRTKWIWRERSTRSGVTRRQRLTMNTMYIGIDFFLISLDWCFSRRSQEPLITNILYFKFINLVLISVRIGCYFLSAHYSHDISWSFLFRGRYIQD